MSSKIKASFKWAVLCVGVVFSGSAFSTIIELDVYGADKNLVIATLGNDSNQNNQTYGINFNTDDLFNDGTNVAFVSGSSITVNFLYGLWTGGSNQNAATISVLLNGSNIGKVTTGNGYYVPGYSAGILSLDSSLFAASSQRLTFVNDTPSVRAAIGRVELNYSPFSQGSGSGSNPTPVPSPAPFALIAIGFIGVLLSRKNYKAV